MKIKIRKNRHYPLIPLFFPKYIKKNKTTTIEREVLFTESCLYQFNDDDQYDLNKLFGFSVGHHFNNSFRFGWRPKFNEHKIEIFTYIYFEGKRLKSELIGEVNLNNWINFRILYSNEGNITFVIFEDYNNMKYKKISTNKPKKYGWGYIMGLYFGGNKKAPHDIYINITLQ